MNFLKSNIVENWTKDRTFVDKCSAICKDLISMLPVDPKDENEVLDIISEFWKSDQNLPAILETLAYIGCDKPKQSMESFKENLPKISVTDTTPPSEIKGNMWFIFEANWGNKFIRAAARTVVEIIISVFMDLLIKQHLIDNEISDQDAELFYTLIKEILDTTGEERATAKFRAISAAHFSNVMTTLSPTCYNALFQAFIDTCVMSGELIHMRAEVDRRHQLKVLMSLYAGVVVAKQPSISEKAIKDGLLTLFDCISRKAETDYDINEPVLLSLTMVMKSLFFVWKNIPQTPEMAKIMKECVTFGRKMSKTKPTTAAHIFCAMLTQFNKGKSKEKLMEMWPRWFDSINNQPNQHDGSLVLRVFMMFLEGPNCLLTIKDREEGMIYRFTPDASVLTTEMKQKMISYIVGNAKGFGKCQDLLAKFLLQYASINTEKFANETIKTLSLTGFTNNDNISALVLFGSEVFKKTSKFPMNAGDKEIVHNVLEDKVINPMMTDSRMLDENCVAFHSMPFLQVYLSQDASFEDSLRYVTQDVYPNSFYPSSGGIGSTLKKWMMQPQLKDVELLKADDHQLSIYKGKGGYKDQDLCRILSLLPNFAFSKLFNARMIALLFSASTQVSAYAHRLIQVCFIGYAEFRVSLISDLLAQTTQISRLTSETMYMILYTVQQLFDISLTFGLDFHGKLDNIVNIGILTGLCSESYAVRYMALNIADQFKKISPSYSISQVIDDMGDVIVEKAMNAAFMSISAEDSLVDCEPASFRDIAKSRYNNLYSFYLPALASAMGQSGKFPVPELVSQMINATDRFTQERCSDFLFSNFVTCIFNIITPSDVTKEDLWDLCRRVMSSGRIKSVYSIFSQLHKEIVPVLYSAKYESNTMAGAVAFSLRLYVEKENVDFMFGNLEWVVSYIQSHNLSISNPVVRDTMTTASLFFAKLFDMSGKNPSGPYLRNKIVTDDLDGFFNKSLWLKFVTKFSASNLGQDMMAQFLSITPAHTMNIQIGHNFSSQTLAAMLFLGAEEYLEKFINEAFQVSSNASKYFLAIAAQFTFGDPKAMVSQWKENMMNAMNDNELSFTSSIFAHTGALLALAFTHIISSASSEQKIYAYQMLAVVATGSLIYRQKTTEAFQMFAKLVEVMFTVNSQLTNLYVSALTSISTILAKNLDFCTEQFVGNMIMAIKNYENTSFIPEMANVLKPWVSDARFDITKQIVFTRTDPQFAYYTFFSLVKDLCDIDVTSEIFVVIDHLLNMPNQQEAVHFMINTLYTLAMNGGDTKNITKLLFHLLQHRTEQATDLVVSNLRLPMWYFYNVISKSNDYEKRITLTVSAITSLLFSSPAKFAKVAHILYAYALINYDEDSISNILLIGLLPNIEMKNFDSDALIWQDMNSREPEFLEKFGRECIEWGLQCGNLTYATRALALYRNVAVPYNSDMAKRIVENIRITSRIAREKNTVELIDYISNLWDTLRVVCTKVGTYNEEIFDLCCEFMSCNVPEILTTVLGLLAYWFTFPEIPEKVRSGKEADLFREALSAPLHLENGSGLFDLLFAIAKNNLGSVVSTDAIITSCLLLSFPIYGSDSTDKSFYARNVSSISDKELAARLMLLSTSSENEGILEYEAALQYAAQMSDEEITIVSNVIASFMIGNEFVQAKYIYNYVISLLRRGCSEKCFEEFIQAAASDEKNLFLKNTLFEICEVRSSSATTKPNDEPFRPLVHLSLNLDSLGKVIDFDDKSKVPPLLVLGDDFTKCLTVDEIARSIRFMKMDTMAQIMSAIDLAGKTKVNTNEGDRPTMKFDYESFTRDVDAVVSTSEILMSSEKVVESTQPSLLRSIGHVQRRKSNFDVSSLK